MSLLEDVFLQDEADEAQELERIIEGDDDEQPRPSTPNSDNNSEQEDEAEEDKRKVDPTSAKVKRVVKNPRFILNPARLTGPRGIEIIPEHFKDFKFKGKGHEKDDLDLVLKKLEHWAYRLYPKFQFEDCLKKIETLGKKRPVMVHLHKIRTDQLKSEDTVVQNDSSDEETLAPVQEEDEFDKLLQQQIDLARTPAPAPRMPVSTPLPDKSLIMPKAASSPSISEDQRERMIRNRQLAEQRRLARLKELTEINASPEINNLVKNDVKQDTDNSAGNNVNSGSNNRDSDKEILDETEMISKSKTNRSNIIDSSDEDDSLVVNDTITVDVHQSNRIDSQKTNSDRHEKNDSVTVENCDFDSVVDNGVSKENGKDHDNSNIDSNEIEHSKDYINSKNNAAHENPNKKENETTNTITDKHQVIESDLENMEVDFCDDF